MILWLNCVNNDKTYTKKNYLLDAADRLGFNSSSSKFIIADYDGFSLQTPPGYVLNIEPFKTFVKGEKWTGIWEIDLVLNRDEVSMSDWGQCDDVFIANSTVPEKYKDFKHLCQLLFQACDPIIHRRIEDITPKYDFVFSGSIGLEFYEKREKYLSLLREKFSFADFGKNHEPKEYVKYLNEARVQFVQSGSNSTAPEGYIAQRFFECLAIGPVLTNYHPDLDLLGLIENIDYMCFRDEIELIEKMNLLIKDKDLRKSIQKNGRKKALMSHTYEHRLMSIINRVREQGAK